MTPDSAAVAAIRPEMRHKAIAAAWTAWQSRHGGKLGPGPAFTEAIDAVLDVLSPAFIERIGALERENARLRKLMDGLQWYWPEGDTSSDACADSPYMVAENVCLRPGDVVGYSRGGVVETRYYAFLPPSDDADSDDEFEVDEASADEVEAKIKAEIARRDARTAIQEPTKVEDGERQGDEG